MKVYGFSIIIFFVIIIEKFIIKYLERKDNCKYKIKKMKNKIDKFFDKNYKIIFIFFAILIFFSRIYKFGEVPKDIGVDEAGAAYDAYTLTNYGVDRYLNSYPLYLINFGGGQSALYAYATIPFIKLLGANLISYRLPELLFYLMGIVVCYILVNKFKNKKMALIYTFLIIICPWNIEASRVGLDCNLLAPMFMLDLVLLLSAKKNWKYAVAGISIGVTLYTYALSWILIPTFLITYIIYMLYLKKINFKHIVFLGIPIFIFAIPLMYMILLNHGIVNKTQFGIFTIPKLPLYRESEISIQNIFKDGMNSLDTIFMGSCNELTIYFFEIPLFVIGYIIGIYKFIKSIENREFSFSGFITIIFTILLITNLFVQIPTINKANILYLPMLYIIALGIVNLSENSYFIKETIIVALSILFIDFEINYYDVIKEKNGMSKYKDNGIMQVTEKIQNEVDAEKYILETSSVQAYIYTLVQNRISPYIFENSKNKDLEDAIPVTIYSYDTYHFYINDEILEEVRQKNNEKKYIFAIEKQSELLKELLTELEKLKFEKEETSRYYIMKNY